MATQFVERMAVETDGRGDAVLMIHGLGGTSNVWTPLMPTLTRHRTVRAGPARLGPLAPGRGPASIERFVQAMLRVCAALACRARARGRPFARHDRGVPSRRRRAAARAEPGAVRPAAVRRPTPARPGLRARGEKARGEGEAGMQAIADSSCRAATSTETRARQPAAVALVRELGDAPVPRRLCAHLRGAGRRRSRPIVSADRLSRPCW